MSVMDVNTLRIWSWLMRSKLFLSAGRNRRISRSAIVAASSASPTVTPGLGFTTMNSAFVLSIRYDRQVNSNGRIAPIDWPGGEKMLAGS